MNELRKKPIVLIILDGYGFSPEKHGNAVRAAKTPFLNEFIESHPHVLLGASGNAVGLPLHQIGNSEVGHLHIGAGRTVYTGLMLINNAIEKNQFTNDEAFSNCIEHAKKYKSKIHILGLLSPGGVHSHENHIFSLAEHFGQTNLECVVHIFCDGRDVPPKSVKESIVKLQKVIAPYPNVKIGTISGRYYAMDRDRRWERSARYYDALVSGKCQNYFSDPLQYVDEQYQKGITDEFIEPAVNSANPDQVKLDDNDAVVFANFRPDRARQLSHLIYGSNYYDFVPKIRRHNLFFVTMMKYEGLNESAVAFKPAEIKNTFGEYISQLGYRQARLAETEKYAHVTFFFDGGHELDLPNCVKTMVPSKKVATYDLAPAMACVEITDKALDAIGKFDFMIMNYANPDMVGHTGNFEKTVIALQELDKQLHRLITKIVQVGGVVFLTADHGNAEVMLTKDNKPVTSHTSNPVYFVCSDKEVSLTGGGDLGNIAPTILDYVELAIPPEMTKKSLLRH